MANNTDASTSGFTVLSFVWRLIAALILVLATFNPSGYSAYHWISGAIRADAFGPLHLLLIGVLLAGWVVFWLATWRALNTLGVILAGVILGALIWLLIDLGIMHAETVSAMTWIALVCLAVILAIGVSWSHISRRLTGQLNVEDVDD
tara:strand:+ start:92 stop:535 length:444 start_codon:yes stop_codon:yes gene_type:complete